MNPYSTTVQVDGRPLHLLVARLSLDEAVPFRVRFQQLGQRAARTNALKTAALENDASYDLALEREVMESVDAARFLVATVRDHVRVSDEDPLAREGIHTGAELLDWIGARTEIISSIAAVVYLENTLSAEGKERWKSVRASASSSGAPTPAPSGDRPETTASPAPDGATTSSAPATASPAIVPSGDQVH